MSNIKEFDGAGLVKAIRKGKLSAREVCEHFSQRIKQAENQIHAFAHFNEETVRRQADAVDARAIKGKLAGLPLGVKDIFDTLDYPTGYGSPIYQGYFPSRDSAVVAILKAEGAILIGKTATSEFAFMHTGPTRNPHGLTRTPGSSSAGSAAGMAAGFFPTAIGTQTAGSLIKPASYCGSFAYKPTFGFVSLEGVKPLAPSLDTAGWFGRSIDDLRLIAEVILGNDWSSASAVKAPLRLVVAKTDFWIEAEQAMQAMLEIAVNRLVLRGHRIEITPMPFDYHRLTAAHQVVNDKEGSRSLAHEYEYHSSLLSNVVLQMRERARKLSYADEAEAKAYISSKTADMDRFMTNYDAILTLSAACEAPEGLEATGTSDFIKTWNALGVPQVNLPILRGPHHMPIGLQLVGRRGADDQILQVARIVSEDLEATRSQWPI